MMKSVKKAIIAALCAGTLVVGSVAGTMAYLKMCIRDRQITGSDITEDELSVLTAAFQALREVE